MATLRLRLVDLTVTGSGVPAASVRFAPGLNLIVGASESGKTFIFEALDFMLGAKSLKPIPEAARHDRVLLSVDPIDRPAFTLQRAYRGGHFEVTEYPNGRAGSAEAPKTLKAAHSADPDDSLSSYLLRAIGLHGRQVRTKATGDKRDLSFRDVCHLTLISEERVIQQSSPVVTGQHVTATAERNVFALFLTGQDDSHIIPQESRAQRNARLDAEAGVVEAILEEKRTELVGISPTPDELPAQIARMDASIEAAARTVVTSQEEIRGVAEQRARLFTNLTKDQARLVFVQEQLKRLRLLDRFYASDRDRLEGVIEASRVMHDLPEGSCPLCSQPLPGDSSRGSSHEEFEAACQREIEKIGILHRDLQAAMTDFSGEQEVLGARIGGLDSELREVDERWQQVLSPTLAAARAELQELITHRMTAARGEGLLTTVRDLEQRLDRIRTERGTSVPRVTFENRVTTAATTDFCKVVEGILRAWKYPDLGSVTFDTDTVDLVIGGQERTNKGKGYRAITYAAFSVGLMRYCRQKGIPHSGVVVIDTPVNPFKGPTTDSPDEKVTDEVKVAFYEHLAADDSGDQIIIMENEEPPESVRSRVNYYHFTKNTTVGRYGFFPVPPRQITAAQQGRYIEYLRNLSEPELQAELSDRISATNHQIIDADEFIRTKAGTFINVWNIDECVILEIIVAAEECRVRLRYAATGEQSNAVLFFGNRISGEATAAIEPNGAVLYHGVSAAVDHPRPSS